jgi:hypothetical protein
MSMMTNLLIPPELVEQLERGNVVLLCGAGISISEGGLPSGQQLAQELAQRSQQADINEFTLPEVAQVYELQMGHQSLIAYLVSRFDDPRLVPLPTHQHIATLPFKLIVTTNWDNLLEEALHQAHKPFVKVVDDIDVAFADNDKTLLVKLHGSIERKDSIVIASDDYYRVLARIPEIANLIRSYFATRTLLFLGYGLADDDFKHLYFGVVDNLGRHKRRAYAVQLNTTSVSIKYWHEKNVEVIEVGAVDFLATLKAHLKLPG